jgi:sterol 3beta-glucosyltransferase
MAALVHHGGAGTTAAGLRCGRPAVIVPFFGDQPYWGKRIAALGAGAPPLPQRSLTAPALAEALVKITRSNEIRHNAAALSQKIRAENGVAEAVRIIEGYAAARTGSNA